MRNAYLIIAHNNWDILAMLIGQLNSKNNGIYIHINSLVEAPDLGELKKNSSKSKVVFVERKEIIWGLYGVDEAIYELLRTARKDGDYDYYHLISGVDVPIKSNSQIESFLIENEWNNQSAEGYRTNYIICHKPFNKTEYFPVCNYNLFVNQWRNRNPLLRKLAKGSALVFNYLQSFIGINRLGEIKERLYKGDAFWSITEELVDYFIENEQWARDNFSKYTFAPEEYIFPTLAMSSKYSSSIYIPNKKTTRANMRCIDFSRGKPYVWRFSDFDELINSPGFFARKFDPKVDAGIIDVLYEYLKQG